MPEQIAIEQPELDALNLLTNQVMQNQAALNRVLAGRKSVITLLENKYKGVFDETSGKMIAKEEPKAE